MASEGPPFFLTLCHQSSALVVNNWVAHTLYLGRNNIWFSDIKKAKDDFRISAKIPQLTENINDFPEDTKYHCLIMRRWVYHTMTNSGGKQLSKHGVLMIKKEEVCICYMVVGKSVKSYWRLGLWCPKLNGPTKISSFCYGQRTQITTTLLVSNIHLDSDKSFGLYLTPLRKFH